MAVEIVVLVPAVGAGCGDGFGGCRGREIFY